MLNRAHGLFQVRVCPLSSHVGSNGGEFGQIQEFRDGPYWLLLMLILLLGLKKGLLGLVLSIAAQKKDTKSIFRALISAQNPEASTWQLSRKPGDKFLHATLRNLEL